MYSLLTKRNDFRSSIDHSVK